MKTIWILLLIGAAVGGYLYWKKQKDAKAAASIPTV